VAHELHELARITAKKKWFMLFNSCKFVKFVGVFCFCFLFPFYNSASDDSATIVMDADTGEVLVLENPQYAVETAFPPGSLLKIFAALYGLKESIFSPTDVVPCSGAITINGEKLKCWTSAGHRAVNLYKALAHSCNVFFYFYGQHVNGADYVRFLRSFGFHPSIPTDAPEETGTLIEPTTPLETAHFFAGSSTRVELTPMQIITAFAAIVNGGKLVHPFFSSPKSEPEPIESIDMSLYFPIIQRALQESSTYGTTAGYYDATGGFGKTGTAPWREGFRTHGWFVGYLPLILGERLRRFVILVFKLEGTGAKDALPAGIQLAKEFLHRALDQQTITVSLFSLLKPKVITLRGRLTHLILKLGEENNEEEKTCQAVEVRYDSSSQLKLFIDHKESRIVERIHIRPADTQGAFTLQPVNSESRDYRGELTIRGSETSLEIINTLPLHDYLEGVIGNEIGEQPEALKSQAVVSRTYALKNLKRHGEYDFCDTTHCQHFTGGFRVAPVISNAVAQTSGLVLKYNQQLCDVYYFSTCGGVTNSYNGVWEEVDVPYLTSINDAERCRLSPHYTWQFKIDEAQLFQHLQTITQKKPVDIRIQETGTGGWVKSIAIIFADSSETRMRGEEFHILIGRLSGWSSLKSANFTFTKEKAQWHFTGKGLGHGVGLCQWGAQVSAQAGQLYPKILQVYFPGTTLTVY